MYAPDRGHALGERVVEAALGGHGRGLRHPVADRDLGHAHLRLHLLHDLDRARRPGHDAGAEAGSVELRELRVLQLRDEHRGNAVQRCAALRLHGLEDRERIKRLRRNDHARPVSRARQVPEHHAETVVERHRNADAVPFGVPQGLADEEAVVEDVVVREGRPLGKPGRAGRVLNVDRVVELQRRLQALELGTGDLVRIVQQRLPSVFEDETLPEPRAAPAHLVEHGDIVRLAEAAGEREKTDAGLPEGVLELGRLVAGVDRHKDRADPRRRVLEYGPLEPVRRPDSNAVAFAHAPRQEAARGPAGLLPELPVRSPVPLVTNDERLAIRDAFRSTPQVRADRLGQQRRRTRAVHVRRRSHQAHPRPGGLRPRPPSVDRRSATGLATPPIRRREDAVATDSRRGQDRAGLLSIEREAKPLTGRCRETSASRDVRVQIAETERLVVAVASVPALTATAAVTGPAAVAVPARAAVAARAACAVPGTTVGVAAVAALTAVTAVAGASAVAVPALAAVPGVSTAAAASAAVPAPAVPALAAAAAVAGVVSVAVPAAAAVTAVATVTAAAAVGPDAAAERDTATVTALAARTTVTGVDACVAAAAATTGAAVAAKTACGIVGVSAVAALAARATVARIETAVQTAARAAGTTVAAGTGPAHVAVATVAALTAVTAVAGIRTAVKAPAVAAGRADTAVARTSGVVVPAVTALAAVASATRARAAVDVTAGAADPGVPADS